MFVVVQGSYKVRPLVSYCSIHVNSMEKKFSFLISSFFMLVEFLSGGQGMAKMTRSKMLQVLQWKDTVINYKI